MATCAWSVEFGVVEKVVFQIIAVEKMIANYVAVFLDYDVASIGVERAMPRLRSCHSESVSEQELLDFVFIHWLRCVLCQYQWVVICFLTGNLFK